MRAKTAVCLLTVLLGPALGASAHATDPAEGRRVAAIWCSSCHRVGAEATGSDATRSFRAIARDPNFTEDGLRAWLAAPHPPMPDLNLTRQEVDAIVAYLRSLRNE